jgi:hypothetical protein
MTQRIQQPRTAKSLLACILTLTIPMMAADNPVPADSSESKPAASAPAASEPASEIELLKKMLADQQRQIDELRRALAGEKLPADKSAGDKQAGDKSAGDKRVEPVISHPSIGEVASTTPMVPPAPTPAPAPIPIYSPSSTASAAPVAQAGSNVVDSPLQFKLGDAFFTPVGFMDMTSVTRSTNTGSGIGTNFGSIPYVNTQAGSLTESRLSP